jgi:hypothetical protein
MQICNATYDRQLDLLDCRASMLGFDLYAIESGDVFEELNRRCFNCSFQEACAVDLRRDPTSPVWRSWPRSGRSHTDLRRACEVGAGRHATTGSAFRPTRRPNALQSKGEWNQHVRFTPKTDNARLSRNVC